MCIANGFTLIQKTDKGWRAFRPNCHSPKCSVCGPTINQKIIAEIIAGNPTRFLTLTCWHVLYENEEAALIAMRVAWLKLHKRIKRRLKAKTVPYYLVVEPHVSGWPHMHIFLRCGSIDRQWIEDNWRALTDAFKVDIRKVRSKEQAAFYAAKYVTKENKQYGAFRTYSKSNNWIIQSEQKCNNNVTKRETRVLEGRLIAKLIQIAQSEGDTFQITKGGAIQVTQHTLRDPPLWNIAQPIEAFFRERFGGRRARRSDWSTLGDAAESVVESLAVA